MFFFSAGGQYGFELLGWVHGGYYGLELMSLVLEDNMVSSC